MPGNPTFGIALNSSSEKGRVMIIGQPQISRPRFLFVTVALMAGLGLVGCANGGAGDEANGANEEAAAEGETDAGSPDEDEAEGPEGLPHPMRTAIRLRSRRWWQLPNWLMQMETRWGTSISRPWTAISRSV